MLEVEVKYRAENWPQIQQQLQAWGGSCVLVRQDADQYFNAPDRDFAQTDEAVRLRCIGEKNYFTYKGPKRGQATKTRKEVELPLGEGTGNAALAEEWLKCVGYRFVRKVSKRREVWTCQHSGFQVEACFDEVDGLGRFVELEIQAEESQFAEAQELILMLAADLGLVQQERRSYLEMLLNSERAGNGN